MIDVELGVGGTGGGVGSLGASFVEGGTRRSAAGRTGAPARRSESVAAGRDDHQVRLR